MWFSGALRPEVIRELHALVDDNIQAVTELFHDVMIDGDIIIRRPPRRENVMSDNPSDTSEEMEDIESD